MSKLHVLAVMLFLVISIQDFKLVSCISNNNNNHVSTYNRNIIQNNRPSVAYLLSRYRPRRAMEGVNVCACCISDLVSICCGACMKRQRQLNDAATSPGSAVSSASAVLQQQHQIQPVRSSQASSQMKDSKVQANVSNDEANQNDGRDLFVHRLNTLQASACRCCAQAPSQRTRCCHWCGTMKDLIPN